MIVLQNLAHAGDVVLSRNVIQEAIAANRGVEFAIQCREQYAYLWSDLDARLLKAPRVDKPADMGHHVINLWFAFFGDMLVNGLTYKSSRLTFNRQAVKLGLNEIPSDERKRFVNLPKPDIGRVNSPSVLVENGRVLSGQRVLDINQYLNRLGDLFRGTTFYCTGPVPPAQKRANVIPVSDWNLKRISALSEHTDVMIARLSAAMVCSFTERNHGRPRVVFGDPLGCPIWDEVGVSYTRSFEELAVFVRKNLK